MRGAERFLLSWDPPDLIPNEAAGSFTWEGAGNTSDPGGPGKTGTELGGPFPHLCGGSECYYPTMVPRASQGTHRCTAGVREVRPPKLAEMVLISICFKAGEPSVLC